VPKSVLDNAVQCHWIVLYTVHVTAFCLGGGRFQVTMYFSCMCV